MSTIVKIFNKQGKYELCVLNAVNYKIFYGCIVYNGAFTNFKYLSCSDELNIDDFSAVSLHTRTIHVNDDVQNNCFKFKNKVDLNLPTG